MLTAQLVRLLLYNQTPVSCVVTYKCTNKVGFRGSCDNTYNCTQ